MPHARPTPNGRPSAKAYHASLVVGSAAHTDRNGRTSIADKAEFETLYDRPYEGKNVVRVTGPFTVESLSPHRVLPPMTMTRLLDRRRAVTRSGRPASTRACSSPSENRPTSSRSCIEQLKVAGVQNRRRARRSNSNG